MVGRIMSVVLAYYYYSTTTVMSMASVFIVNSIGPTGARTIINVAPNLHMVRRSVEFSCQDIVNVSIGEKYPCSAVTEFYVNGKLTIAAEEIHVQDAVDHY